MISQLTGTVTAAGAAWFVIDVSGVGFLACCDVAVLIIEIVGLNMGFITD